MNQHFPPEESNLSSKPDSGSFDLTCLPQPTSYMELLVYQQQQQIAELKDKHKQHDVQALATTAHLVEKVACLEEQLKSKDEQLRISEELRQQAVALDKTKLKGAAKHKRVGNGWILFMKQRSLEKDLGEKFETLGAFLEYAKNNRAKKKHKHKHNKVPLPKKGKGIGLKEFLKEMSEEYKTFDKEMKAEYNDAAKRLALGEIDTGASPKNDDGIHM